MIEPTYPKVSLHNILIALALLLVLGCFAQLSAQWTIPDGNGNISNTNSGNVGIGTSSPNALLEIRKSQSAGTTIIVDNPFTTSPNAAYSGIFLKQNGALRLFVGSINDNNNTHFGGSGAVQFWNYVNGPMLFSTNNTEAMRITGGGNLGIGTTSPGEKLVTVGNMLVGNITSHTQLYSGYDAQSNVIMELGYGTATSAITPLASLVLSKNQTSPNNSIGVISFANSSIANGSEKRLASIGAATDGAVSSGALMLGTTLNGTVNERMRITSGGNIGIGTSTPSYSLDLNGGVSAFRVKGATTSASDTLAIVENSSAVQMIVKGDGKVGIGRSDPTEKLDVVGNIKVSGNINAKYQDLAEWVDSAEDLRAGTVVILDVKRPNHVMASIASYDTRVAGVISDRPGITLGEHADGKVLVATTGRVKIKVSAKNGPINIGDLLVTSDQTGVAMKSNAVKIGGVHMHRPGTLIGKALEPLAQGTGEILVLLSLQ
ncbi:MAG TPA: hypothetical protein VKB05_10065 [Pyrinomonadaceae bacterium]|nr:hypothetical protein [Pyrinomonadaceae bacterium]